MEKPKMSPEDGMSNQESKTDHEKERQERVSKILELVKKINESGESIPFSGIHQEAYLKMKENDDEFPGYTTTVDEIIERCRKEGIKIVTGKHPGSGNVFVLPAESNNIEMDSISPHQLALDGIENEDLIELIQLITEKKT